jgi:hypothetical protein
MAGSLCDAPDAGRRCLRRDGRPGQQQAANHGQRRFHVLNIIREIKISSTAFGFFLSIFGFLVSRPDF